MATTEKAEPDGSSPEVVAHDPVEVQLSDLRPHPRNYRVHPEDQLAHLEQSLREHGQYRNVVVTLDGTILAGHGVVEAARRLGLRTIRAIRLNLSPDDPKALKILTADNELPRLAEVDDRTLSNLLAEIREVDLDGLLGTGFDDAMLANLVMVTRPASEIADLNEAALWVGMPEFEAGDDGFVLVVHCVGEDDRGRLIEQLGVTVSKKIRRTWSAWWPPQDRQDLSSVQFDG